MSPLEKELFEKLKETDFVNLEEPDKEVSSQIEITTLNTIEEKQNLKRPGPVSEI